MTRIIIAAVDGSIAGFVVDRVKDITSRVKDVMLKPDNGYPWLECADLAIKTGKGSVPIINLSMLLTEDEKKYLRAPSSTMSL